MLWSLVHLYNQQKVILSYVPAASLSHPELPLSIILCTEGNAVRILRYLEHILNQKYNAYELIVVCKNTPSATLHALQQNSAHNSKLKVIDISHLSLPYTEKKQALHYGINQSIYNWIVTIDDDCYPSDEFWLRTISDSIQSENADIVLGLSPYISQPGLLNQWIRYDSFQTAIQFAYHTIIGKAYMGIGRNMAFKKDLWSSEYLEKYKNLGSGDDTTLVNFYSSTHKINFFLQPVVYTFPKTQLREWLWQKIRHVHKGKYLAASTNILLAKPLLLSIGFWFSIWLWMSYFAFHFILLFFIVVYCVMKTLLHYKIARHINWKFKPIFYTFAFDVLHSLCLLIIPFFASVAYKKWDRSF